MGISEPIWYISILVTFFVCLAWVNTPSHGHFNRIFTFENSQPVPHLYPICPGWHRFRRFPGLGAGTFRPRRGGEVPRDPAAAAQRAMAEIGSMEDLPWQENPGDGQRK